MGRTAGPEIDLPLSVALPSATVVLAVLDREDTVAECIDSLLALDYPSDLLEAWMDDHTWWPNKNAPEREATDA